MSIIQLKNEALRYLLDGYISDGGTSIYSINEITDKYGQDSNEVGEYLLNNGWVKNQNFRHDGFVCSISPRGIEEIESGYFSSHFSTLISTLGLTGEEWIGIIETLSLEPKDFQRAHDIGTAIKQTGLAEVQFQHDEIFVKLTFEGKLYYEKSKATFF